jgi:hypothetical protein
VGSEFKLEDIGYLIINEKPSGVFSGESYRLRDAKGVMLTARCQGGELSCRKRGIFVTLDTLARNSGADARGVHGDCCPGLV